MLQGDTFGCCGVLTLKPLAIHMCVYVVIKIYIYIHIYIVCMAQGHEALSQGNRISRGGPPYRAVLEENSSEFIGLRSYESLLRASIDGRRASIPTAPLDSQLA